MNGSMATAAGLGAVTGSRSMLAAAITARELSRRRRLPRGAGRLERWLARPGTARTLAVVAAGELVADKLPGIPDRVTPGPLAIRAFVGGLLGAAALDADHRAAGAAAGAVGAIAGTFAGWFLRREFGRVTMLPDVTVGIGEDAMAASAARELARHL